MDYCTNCKNSKNCSGCSYFYENMSSTLIESEVEPNDV